MLDENARLDIAAAAATVLSPEASDAFCATLEAPMPVAMQEPLARKAARE